MSFQMMTKNTDSPANRKVLRAPAVSIELKYYSLQIK